MTIDHAGSRRAKGAPAQNNRSNSRFGFVAFGSVAGVS
jgi:hypothetical protein